MNENHHSLVCGTLGLDKYVYNVVRLAKLKKPRPSPACVVIAHFVRFKRTLEVRYSVKRWHTMIRDQIILKLITADKFVLTRCF